MQEDTLDVTLIKGHNSSVQPLLTNGAENNFCNNNFCNNDGVL